MQPLRVWHTNLPDWPGVIEPSPGGSRVRIADGVLYFWVRWERETDRVASPGWVRSAVVRPEPRPEDATEAGRA